MVKIEIASRWATLSEQLTFLRWITRPFRAMKIAYGYVLRGEKVETPMNWKDI